MKVIVQINRKSVMGIVEGISVTISMHNGGTPTFEQLWASDAEGPKLDIYYREAIGDLERHLIEYIKQSSAQFDLQANGEDYVCILELSDHWPPRLKGLLSNKMQDYLVHSVTAGWINDFEGLTVKQDFQAMATTDLDDIRVIVQNRSFTRAEAARGTDTDKAEEEYSTTAGARQTDTNKAEEERLQTAGARVNDTDKEASEYSVTAGARSEDEQKAITADDQKAGARTGDKNKPTTAADQKAGKRTTDASKAATPDEQKAGQRHDTKDTEKGTEQSADTGARHEDNAEVRHWRDDTDWSDTRDEFFLRHPHRIRKI